ncbi:MAG: ATP-binding protein [Gammaproteobacteria bacterium]|nr:ATP-binding protein [Gammaproteobacteria bacterium]
MTDCNQKLRLTELLLECPSFQDAGARKAFLSILPSAVSDSIQASDINKIHAVNVVNACLNHPGGLDRLMESLHFFDGETAQFQALLAFRQGGPEKNDDAGETNKPARYLKVFLNKLPDSERNLFGREAEKALLDEAWDDPHIHIFSLVAWGGAGKTALVNHWLNHWLNRMEQKECGGADRVYAWSFYSQGAAEGRQSSADEFLAHALQWFGDTNPARGSPWDKGVRLAELLRRSSALLILDGLEPLQYPPGEMQGRLKDQGLQALLKELARSQPGLCVITTRTEVANLEHIPSAHQIFLERLAPEAGAQLLKELGVHGTAAELQKASAEFEGHALALTLLGRYLAAVHGGEVRKRDLIPRLAEEEKAGGHARRVMESYEHWLAGKPEVNILYLMGLFDRPAPGGAVEALRAEPAIAGLTEDLKELSSAQWAYALLHLRDLRLLAAENFSRKTNFPLFSPASQKGTDFSRNKTEFLDCHPLVREHFGEKLRNSNPAAWREAHTRLYEYFKNIPKEQPDTLEEMEPLFMAAGHGCQAGRHQEAMDEVYWPRIQRKNEFFSTRKLGAFGADLAALAGFFDTPWDRPAAGLTDEDKAAVLGWAGFWLRALGRLREAAQPMQTALKTLVKQEDWRNAAQGAGNLSELWLTLGEMKQAVAAGRQSVTFADRSGDGFMREAMRTTLADALHQAGEAVESETLFRGAEAMQKQRQPDNPFLYSLRGFQFCDLLLDLGHWLEVQKRVKKLFEWRQPSDSLLDIALESLSLGRAHALQAQLEKSGDFLWAMECLNRAVAGLREAGQQDYLPHGLLARAALYRDLKEFKKAGADLAEANEIAERGGMELFLADIQLETARLMLVQGDKKAGRQALAEAAEKIAKTGYGRRERELAELAGCLEK